MVPDAWNPPSDLFSITEVNFELSAPLGRSGARHGEFASANSRWRAPQTASIDAIFSQNFCNPMRHGPVVLLWASGPPEPRARSPWPSRLARGKYRASQKASIDAIFGPNFCLPIGFRLAVSLWASGLPNPPPNPHAMRPKFACLISRHVAKLRWRGGVLGAMIHASAWDGTQHSGMACIQKPVGPRTPSAMFSESFAFLQKYKKRHVTLQIATAQIPAWSCASGTPKFPARRV